ncbi:hypothetical protein EB796_004273 [Bugula neritina]|uniref:Uncharacterized protein n=1 Tax=Bugula neritina TaxID=10212 RepID=A0A7J7KFJ4_BUGNE|nr:hypothetical protein EB796_004273 [Bugula neritina]
MYYNTVELHRSCLLFDEVRQPRALVGELEKGRIGIACFHSYNNIRLLSSVGDFPNAITNFSASILLNC